MPERGREPMAAALRYRSGMAAPAVVASGRGLIARRIEETAREAGVPVRKDPGLAQALALLDLGDAVPEALYVAVAEALAWAYGLDLGATRPR